MFILYHYYSITVTYSSPSPSFLNTRRFMFPFRNTSRSKFVADREALSTRSWILFFTQTCCSQAEGIINVLINPFNKTFLLTLFPVFLRLYIQVIPLEITLLMQFTLNYAINYQNIHLNVHHIVICLR